MKNLFIIVFLCGLLHSAPGQAPVLPKPSGEYLTGVTYLHLVDAGRKELFDNSGRSQREMTVKAWYPAEEKSSPEPYLLNADAAVTNCMFPEVFRVLKSNSSRDVPIAAGKKKYPVLIFSHGWGEHYSQNSILMEELASHGYIVFSVAHHHECRYSAYPDGRIIQMDYQSLRLRRIWMEMQNPKAMELLKKLYSAEDDQARQLILTGLNDLLPTGLQESPKYWAEDISFFLDQLTGINGGSPLFKGRLDLGRIGVFGMSLGGMASGEFCLTSDKVKAGLSLDGGLYGSLLEKKLHVPFLFLNSRKFLGYGALFTAKSTADCYSLCVRDSEHFNFSDYSIYPFPLVTSLLGGIEGKRTIEMMNVIVRAFFDKYVKGIGEIDLVKEARRYPDIEIATNLKNRGGEPR